MINLSLRSEFGSQVAKNVRKADMIPVALYSKNCQEHGNIEFKDAKDLLYTPNFKTKTLDLKLGDKSYKAITQAVQYHPITDKPVHIDFFVLEADQKIRVKLPVEFVNKDKCPGFKLGGILNLMTKEITSIVNSDDIPSSIKIDLEGKQLGDSMKLRDVQIPNGVKVLKLDENTTLASVIAPSKPKE